MNNEQRKASWRKFAKKKWAEDEGHRQRKSTYDRQYASTHREQMRSAHKRHRQKYKTEVLTHYGNGVVACALCGFDDIRALSIDHMDGGGLEHFRQLGCKGGYKFYKWLRDNGYPEGFRVLCMNCQWIEREKQ